MVGAAIGMIVIDGYDDGLLQMSMPTNQALMVGVIGALAGYNYDTVRISHSHLCLRGVTKIGLGFGTYLLG